MKNTIHPLQESTTHLLDALYGDKHLDVTTAMLLIQNGRHSSLEAIPATLKRYKSEEPIPSSWACLASSSNTPA